MSVANKSLSKWHKVVGVSMVCGLALVGCDRSDKEEHAETATPAEKELVVTEDIAATIVGCDDPVVQDRLKTALKSTLNQQAQTLSTKYENTTKVSLASGAITDKTNTIVIDVQNAAVLQAANANGMTTCQASVSMTLPSEDLYQASQIQAANNQPSLQSRLATTNVRINNHMLVDDAFTYVVGAKNDQVRTRIAGQPALLTVVADVMASSVLQSAIEKQRAERAAAQAKKTPPAPIRKPVEVTPVQPIRPVAPPTINKPTINKPSADNPKSSADDNGAATPAVSKSVPEDDSIDMVIIEDEAATY